MADDACDLGSDLLDSNVERLEYARGKALFLAKEA
jgi:hypothetical protein